MSYASSSGPLVCSQCATTYNLVSQPPKVDGKCDKCGGALLARSDDQPESIRKRLEVYGVRILDSVPIPDCNRFEFRDPFGNRVEFVEPV